MFKAFYRSLTKEISFQRFQCKYPPTLFKTFFPATPIRYFANTLKEIKLPFEKHYEVKPFLRTIYHRLNDSNNEYLHHSNTFMKADQDPKVLEEARVRMEELNQHQLVFGQLHNILNSLEEIKKMMKETPDYDKESLELLQSELEDSEGMLQEVEEKAVDLLVPQEKYDDCSSISIEIRPAAGGSEASLFADDVLQMFQSYMTLRGWNTKLVSYQTDGQIGKGCKFGHLKATGQEIYKYMKCESGVHKVIRVPETEKLGRLHSSTISVVVLPEIPLNFQLNEKDLRIEFMRSSGAGGQHVNKTESACRVTHIPTGLSVSIQDDRTQHTNKAKALAILKEKLFTMEVLKNQEDLNSQRKEQMATGDRSDKIRTYNFPQSRITDHRTGLTLFGIERMLKGELLEEFIEEYLRKIYNNRINTFLEGEN